MKQLPRKKRLRKKGGGRKKGEPTRTKTFRINAKNLDDAEKAYGRKLNQKANEWISGLI